MLTDSALRALADRFGTPLYVFDDRALVQRVRYLREALPTRVGICFAIKANPFVLPALEPLVDRLEVCSPGEYRICRALGLPHDKIVVSGVHKDIQTVSSAVSERQAPAAVTIESVSQLDLVLHQAATHSARVPVLLRLTSGNQFGMGRDDVKAAVTRLRHNGRVRLAGLQFFSGTQKNSLKRLARELRGLDAFIQELEQDCGWRVPELEFGPGFPVSYFAHDDFDEKEFLAEFSALIEGMSFQGHIMLELGRSLTASCGTYLTRVVDAKVNAGQRYAIVDGGMHQLVYFGQSMAMKQPCCHLLGADDENAAPADEELWNICGSLCTVNDILAKQLPLSGLEQGSILAFENAGAYCMTEGISLFLSRDLPRVIMVDERGAPTLVRDGLRTDILNTPLFPIR